MIKESAFDIGLPGYSMHRLTFEDIGAIQELSEKCLDFMLLVDGRPAEPASVEEDFLFVPPGHTVDNKFVFGIFDAHKEMVGILDTMCGYPEEDTWWIGLLMLAPETRSKGNGEKVLEGFTAYVQVQGCQAIMLGVVEENQRAQQFWSRMGFESVRKTEPQEFGNKTHVVIVMRKELQKIKE
jgi:ribosomal protein S18 acetylase RimI-like enzyme